MKFDWGRTFYLALRNATIGVVIGLIMAVLLAIISGPQSSHLTLPIIGFWMFGIARIGWEALSKKYPDA